MTGASIETTLELWASSLRDVRALMRGLFTQERVAASANLFLDGLPCVRSNPHTSSRGRVGAVLIKPLPDVPISN